MTLQVNRGVDTVGLPIGMAVCPAEVCVSACESRWRCLLFRLPWANSGKPHRDLPALEEGREMGVLYVMPQVHLCWLIFCQLDTN